MYGDVSTGTSQVFANDAFTLMNNVFKPTGTGVNLPQGVRIAQDPFLDEMDESTGHQIGRIAVTPGADILGANTSNWAAPAGACITWSTNTFIQGRRLKGRLFLVPLSAACFAADGTLDSGFLTSVQASITTYINGQSVPVVFHRPTGQNTSDGLMSPIITGQMKDHVSVLTTRRD